MLLVSEAGVNMLTSFWDLPDEKLKALVDQVGAPAVASNGSIELVR